MALLQREGWWVNHKRVERIWHQEGLKVPQKQPKRGRLWLNDGSCVRLRPTHRNHVWSYDFVAERTHDGRPLRLLTVMDEYSRECLAIVVERRLCADDVLECLAGLFVRHGVPEYIRSDNGSELMEWGIKFRPIKPGSPHLNGKVERSQRTDLDEFYSTVDIGRPDLEQQLQEWQHYYNWHRSHSSLKGKTPIDAVCELFDKTPLGEEVDGLYDVSKERIQEQNYRLDLQLRKLKRSI